MNLCNASKDVTLSQMVAMEALEMMTRVTMEVANPQLNQDKVDGMVDKLDTMAWSWYDLDFVRLVLDVHH